MKPHFLAFKGRPHLRGQQVHHSILESHHLIPGSSSISWAGPEQPFPTTQMAMVVICGNRKTRGGYQNLSAGGWTKAGRLYRVPHEAQDGEDDVKFETKTEARRHLPSACDRSIHRLS